MDSSFTSRNNESSMTILDNDLAMGIVNPVALNTQEWSIYCNDPVASTDFSVPLFIDRSDASELPLRVNNLL